MKKPTTCPCCKYSPRLTPKGNIYKGSLPFEEVTVLHDFDQNYNYKSSTIGLSCPKCGVIFREVKS
jgi:hypothetical protein